MLVSKGRVVDRADIKISPRGQLVTALGSLVIEGVSALHVARVLAPEYALTGSMAKVRGKHKY